MPNASISLVAVFDDVSSAESAKRELVREGFNEQDIEFTSTGSFTSDAASGNAALSGSTPAYSADHGIGGWFRSMFSFDNEESGLYTAALQKGGTAISLRTDEARVDRAISILNQHGAIDVDERAPGYREQGVTDLGGSSGQYVQGEPGEKAIPIIQEEVAVGKRAIKRGGVRVISTITEKPVEEQVTLRDETLRVERRPVNRPATEADFAAASKPEAVEMTEVHEEAVVSKQARVVEEVTVGKETSERTETIRDTVRRTDVKVEKTGDQKDTQAAKGS